jgi:hypothetical protein
MNKSSYGSNIDTLVCLKRPGSGTIETHDASRISKGERVVDSAAVYMPEIQLIARGHVIAPPKRQPEVNARKICHSACTVSRV